MKVELDNIKLGYSSLTDSIFAGTIEKEGVWRHKKNVTDDFIRCVIARWEDHVEVITAGDDQWEITVKKLK